MKHYRPIRQLTFICSMEYKPHLKPEFISIPVTSIQSVMYGVMIANKWVKEKELKNNVLIEPYQLSDKGFQVTIHVIFRNYDQLDEFEAFVQDELGAFDQEIFNYYENSQAGTEIGRTLGYLKPEQENDFKRVIELETLRVFRLFFKEGQGETDEIQYQRATKVVDALMDYIEKNKGENTFIYEPENASVTIGDMKYFFGIWSQYRLRNTGVEQDGRPWFGMEYLGPYWIYGVVTNAPEWVLVLLQQFFDKYQMKGMEYGIQ